MRISEEVRREAAIFYCTHRFEPYGRFATLPLMVTLLRMNDHDSRRRYLDLTYAAKRWKDVDRAEIQNYIDNHDFEGRGFFTVQDYQLFFTMVTVMRPRTDEQIERDRQELLNELAQPTKMLKCHAESMLKAVEFWRLRYNTNYREWIDQYDRAMDPDYSSDEQIGVDEVDEGYSSEGVWT
jgi:hypothetical protein